MAFRFCNQSVVVDLPKFVTTDPHAFPGTTRSDVGSSQCPMELHSLVVVHDSVHGHDHVRNVVMNACASLAIAARPTAGAPLLMLIEPRSAKKAATFFGS